MKKIAWIFAIIAITILFANPVSAQDNIVKLRPVGVWVQTLQKVDVNLGPGISGVERNIANYTLGIAYERIFSDKISAALDFDFVFAGKVIIVMRPNVNFYILDSAPNQLYVGGYFDAGFNAGSFGTHIGLGPKVGYQYLLFDDQFAISGELGLGFGMFTDGAADGTGVGAGANVYFNIGAGYIF